MKKKTKLLIDILAGTYVSAVIIGGGTYLFLSDREAFLEILAIIGSAIFTFLFVGSVIWLIFGDN